MEFDEFSQQIKARRLSEAELLEGTEKMPSAQKKLLMPALFEQGIANPELEIALRLQQHLKLQGQHLKLQQQHLKWQGQHLKWQGQLLKQALEFEAMLFRITNKVRDSLEESKILQTAVQELAVVLDVGCCNTALYNFDSGTSTIGYEYATSNPGAQASVIQLSAFGEVYQQIFSGQYCQFCSITPNPHRGRVTMLACPIQDDSEVLGDLWLVTQPDRAFNELEIRLVQQVAAQCAIALRQARLYQVATSQVVTLEKLNSLKDDFLSTVSHELRTPMSNIKMAISLLKTSPTAERSQHYLDILQAECNREIALINDLLDLQRLETASNTSLQSEAICLEEMLTRMISSFHDRMRQYQQTIRLNLPQDLPSLQTDRASLERILAELLNNACKYTRAGGEIGLNVCYKSTEATTIFTISNSAEIPADQLSRIFDKFYRVPNSDPWKQGGTGLGLALVQKLVEQLQGTISVDSIRGWTTFTIQLHNQRRA